MALPLRNSMELPFGRAQTTPQTIVTEGDSGQEKSVVTRRSKFAQQEHKLVIRPVSGLSEISVSTYRGSFANSFDTDREFEVMDGAVGLDEDYPRNSQEQDTPHTADIATDPPVLKFKYRREGLKNAEVPWFEKIRVFESLDEGDCGIPCGVAPSSQNHSVATDAFGKLKFEGRPALSWYIRLAFDTKKDVIEELLGTKLEILGSDSRPLRIHCIDYDRFPDSTGCWSSDPSEEVDRVTTKLKDDLQVMCENTVGIMMTWSGEGGDNFMHLVLEKIIQDSPYGFPDNLAVIATPHWGALNDDLKQKLLGKAKTVALERSDLSSSSPDRTSGISSSHFSPYASHYLFLDAPWFDYASDKSHFRRFHFNMIDAMETYERKPTTDEKKINEIPAVYILINGHHDALKMVVKALKNKMPVVIVKGSGGYADVIADVYMKAEPAVVKEIDAHGCVRTRIGKVAGKCGEDYLKDKSTRHRLLETIFNKLDYLTIYHLEQTLDFVFFEALLKNKQEAKFGWLVEIVRKLRKAQSIVQEPAAFMESETVQMDFFIKALKQNSVDVVKLFFKDLQILDKLMEHFHTGHVLQLYSQDTCTQQSVVKLRTDLKQLLRMPTCFPLRCPGDQCPSCLINVDSENRMQSLEAQRTCLHPIQELFLWTLDAQHADMAVVFWEKCEDKIAAALVAEKVFRSKTRCGDVDMQQHMKENARRFQDLALQTLKNCHNICEGKTEMLLMKHCPWWGNLSVLQLAIETDNKVFMAQTPCKNIMTRIWRGKSPTDPDMQLGPCQLAGFKMKSGPGACSCNMSPRLTYVFSFLSQLMFLMLFSTFLLFDLGPAYVYTAGTLSGWVFAIAVEEIRQLWMTDPGSSGGTAEDRSCCSRIWAYLRQKWNWVDLAMIIFFGIGMLLFAVYGWHHRAGRIVLCFDIIFFFVRTFPMLMVNEQLGLMLVMVSKMVKDTVVFMIILLVVVLAYAVTSESLLYPESEFSEQRMFDLFRKGYWQVFGELFLEEIEIRGDEVCSVGNSSLQCPDKIGSYIVPILLGIHVMITHVLLLNLLIANFGVTFSKVHDEAIEFQTWHRYQIILEYSNRASLPPPLNLLSLPVNLLCFCCGRCRCCFSKCCRKRGAGQGEQFEMQTRAAAGEGPRNSARDFERVTVRRSSDQRFMDIVWSSPPSHGDEYQVIIRTRFVQRGSSVGFDRAWRRYRVFRKVGRQALTVWNLDPGSIYIVLVDGCEVEQKERATTNPSPKKLDALLKFEEKQALCVCQQADVNSILFQQFQEQAEILRKENDRLSREVDSLRKEVDGSRKDVDRHGEELKKKFGQLGEDIKRRVDKLYRRVKNSPQGQTTQGTQAMQKQPQTTQGTQAMQKQPQTTPGTQATQKQPQTTEELLQQVMRKQQAVEKLVQQSTQKQQQAMEELLQQSMQRQQQAMEELLQKVMQKQQQAT